MFKLCVEAYVASEGIESGPLEMIAAVDFLYYSGVLLLLSVGIVIAVSFATKASVSAKIQGLTYGSLSDADKQDIHQSRNQWDVIEPLSCLRWYLVFICTSVFGWADTDTPRQEINLPNRPFIT